MKNTKWLYILTLAAGLVGLVTLFYFFRTALSISDLNDTAVVIAVGRIFYGYIASLVVSVVGLVMAIITLIKQKQKSKGVIALLIFFAVSTILFIYSRNFGLMLKAMLETDYETGGALYLQGGRDMINNGIYAMLWAWVLSVGFGIYALVHLIRKKEQ